MSSLRSAREKALISKTVQEMNSLQKALELYKNNNGHYPQDGNDPDIPTAYNYNDSYTGTNGRDLLKFVFDSGLWTTMEDFFKLYLVDNKLISKVPHAPNYPNNCTDINSPDCYILGFSLNSHEGGNYNNIFHSERTLDSNFYMTCGGKKIENYAIYFYAGDKDVSLPKMGVSSNGIFKTMMEYYNGSNAYTSDVLPYEIYCIAG